MKNSLLTLLICIAAIFSFAQSRNCPTSIDFNTMQTQEPARYQRFMNLQSFTTNYINNQSGASYRLADPNGIIIIPVVVHVLHRNEAVGTGLNISLAQIQSQIDVLNEDFRRLNANRTNTPPAFTGVASDYNFEFRLACQDPNGNASNGVTRRFTNRSGFTYTSSGNGPNENSIGIKMTNTDGEDPWPTDRYLNIWVGNFTDGTLGYATWPADFATNPNVDGVVISTTAMGRTGNVTAPYDGGRTATHEVGHWLNLRHIWGDATCGDDFVADTPVQQDRNFGCPTFPLIAANSAQRWFGPRCNATDPSSMFMNYMDYTDDNCMNIFTNGQRLRGRAIFAAGGPRATFLDNYFRIQQPASTIICSGSLILFNPNCLAPTWTIVSGPATINSIGNNQVVINATGTGLVTLRATANNYISEINFNISFSGPPADNTTLIYTNGQRGVDPLTLCAGCSYNFICDFVPGATSYTWILPTGFSLISAKTSANPGIRTSNTDGYYVLYCRVNNACGSNWTHSLGINVSSGGGQQQRIAVYPNPTSTILTIESTVTDLTITETQSIDKSQTKNNEEHFSAKLLNQFNIELRGGESKNGKIAFDIQNLQDGIYYLHVQNGQELITKQIQIKK